MFIAGCATSPSPESLTHYGPIQPLGAGTAQTFVTVANGRPTALGVRVTETALASLPMDGLPPSGLETVLRFPSDARVAPYDHVSFDWMPHGHEPDGIYTLPHFDVHFYMMTEAERDAISPARASFATEAAVPPDASILPAGYVPTPDALPRMGVHWVDPSSPEFTPDGFSRTFIYGFWNGKMTFVEPMLTKAFIESVQTRPHSSVTFDIPQAQQVEKAGYYPTTYGVRHDATAQAYDIVLEGLALRSPVAR